MNNRKKLIRDSLAFDSYLGLNQDDYSVPYANMTLEDMYDELNSALNHNIVKLAKNLQEYGAIHQFLTLAKEVKDNIKDYKYYHQNISNISKMYSLINTSIPKALGATALIVVGVALILTSVAAAVLSGGFSTPFSIAGIALGLTLLKSAALVTTTLGIASLIGGGILAKQSKPAISTPFIKERAEHFADKAYNEHKKPKYKAF